MGFEVVRLDHVQLAMPPGREADAEAFYSGLLGLERIRSPNRWRRGAAAGSSAERWPCTSGVEEDFRPARKAHPALVVRGLAALEVVLTAGGAPVRANPDREPGRGAYVDDPFGNRIELGRGRLRAQEDGGDRYGGGASASGPGTVGRRRDIRAPPSGAFSAWTVPPSAFTTWATMARPRPDPGRPRAAGER